MWWEPFWWINAFLQCSLFDLPIKTGNANKLLFQPGVLYSMHSQLSHFMLDPSILWKPITTHVFPATVEAHRPRQFHSSTRDCDGHSAVVTTLYSKPNRLRISFFILLFLIQTRSLIYFIFYLFFGHETSAMLGHHLERLSRIHQFQPGTYSTVLILLNC